MLNCWIDAGCRSGNYRQTVCTYILWPKFYDDYIYLYVGPNGQALTGNLLFFWPPVSCVFFIIFFMCRIIAVATILFSALSLGHTSCPDGRPNGRSNGWCFWRPPSGPLVWPHLQFHVSPSLYFLPVNAMSHEPLCRIWWNFAHTYMYLDNGKNSIKFQIHRSKVIGHRIGFSDTLTAR